MNKVKSSFWGMVLSLTLISAAVAVLLGWVFGVTDKIIQEISEKNRQSGIIEVVAPGCSDMSIYAITDPVTVNGSNVYNVLNAADSTLAGIAVESSDNGFGGELTVLFGFNTDWEITGYKVMKHSETPGLGAQVENWFKSGPAVAQGSGNMMFKRKKPVESTLVGAAVGGSHNVIGMNMTAARVSLSKDGGTIDAITASTITSRAFVRVLKKAYAAANPDAAGAVDATTGASQTGGSSSVDAATGATQTESSSSVDAATGATQSY